MSLRNAAALRNAEGKRSYNSQAAKVLCDYTPTPTPTPTPGKMGDEGAPFGRVNYNTPLERDSVVRTFEEQMKFVERTEPWKFVVRKNFVPGLIADIARQQGTFYLNFSSLLYRDECGRNFLRQIDNIG